MLHLSVGTVSFSSFEGIDYDSDILLSQKNQINSASQNQVNTQLDSTQIIQLNPNKSTEIIGDKIQNTQNKINTLLDSLQITLKENHDDAFKDPITEDLQELF